MTLESAWIYAIHHFQLKFVSIYRKEVKIIAITYFLATLPILATKIAITRYLVIVSATVLTGTSCIRFALKFCCLLVYLKSILNKIRKISFHNYFRYFLFWNRCKMVKIVNFWKIPIGTCLKHLVICTRMISWRLTQ